MLFNAFAQFVDTLSFLNVFRSNLSYGRYWDGRGQLVALSCCRGGGRAAT